MGNILDLGTVELKGTFKVNSPELTLESGGFGNVEFIEDFTYEVNEDYRTPSGKNPNDIAFIHGYHIKTNKCNFYILVENEKGKNDEWIYLYNGMLHKDDINFMVENEEFKYIQVLSDKCKVSCLRKPESFDYSSHYGTMIYIGDYMFNISARKAAGGTLANGDTRFVILTRLVGVDEIKDKLNM